MNPSRSLRRGFPAVEGKRNVVSRKEASVERSLRRALDRIRHSLSPLKGFALPSLCGEGRKGQSGVDGGRLSGEVRHSGVHAWKAVDSARVHLPPPRHAHFASGRSSPGDAIQPRCRTMTFPSTWVGIFTLGNVSMPLRKGIAFFSKGCPSPLPLQGRGLVAPASPCAKRRS